MKATAADTVYQIAEQCFPGRVYRTLAECQAAITTEQAERQVEQDGPLPGDRERGLIPLAGTPQRRQQVAPIRWRVIDEIGRLTHFCNRVRDGLDTSLSVEEATNALWLLGRLRDHANAETSCSWWWARRDRSTEDILATLR